jgi:CheY-like chemotaxis protein
MSETGALRVPGLQGRWVLLVEDETIVALLLREMLSELGCRVTHAGSVEAALAALGERRFDIAVLDLNLDGDPADAVVEALEADGIPFIFTTGYGLEALSPRWTAWPVLQKPFGAEALAKALVRAFAHARIAAVSRTGPRQP